MVSATSPIAVIGLGYVGLPLAIAFGRSRPVIGFDVSEPRIKALRDLIDQTREVDSEELRAATLVRYTNVKSDLKDAKIFIVCVPTPVDSANKPDFKPLIEASETIGRQMSPGATVIFESTVYPGATEEICVPALEASSGLKWKKDFFVGYSPERINPGDRVRKLPDIKKIVAGDSPSTLGLVSELYRSIITAGVFEAESIQVAEAAKIIENTQRDINIALINECAMIFNKLNINTSAVLEAAGTKWNFLPFRPGLVGGHCIGVDPYYLTEKAEMAGHHPKMILAGRDINDGMAKYIAEQTIKTMLSANLKIKGAKILIMGLTFKEDVADLRNSKVIDLIRELKEYRTTCLVHDPEADSLEASEHYKIALTKWDDVPVCDVAIIAVPHCKFLKMGLEQIKTKITPGGCLIDVKSSFRRADVEKLGLSLWQL